MVEDLYEDLPDMELEKDHNSFRQKQRKRRKRRQNSTLDVEPEQNGTSLQLSNSLVFFLNCGGVDKLSEEAMLIFNAKSVNSSAHCSNNSWQAILGPKCSANPITVTPI